MGYTMMLFIVAIQGIPEDLYEAAEIDGAGRLCRFINVTLPQVKEMTFVMCVTTVTGAFLVFNDVYILTGGGPATPPPRWPYTCTRTALRSIRWAMLPRLRSVCSSSP